MSTLVFTTPGSGDIILKMDVGSLNNYAVVVATNVLHLCYALGDYDASRALAMEIAPQHANQWSRSKFDLLGALMNQAVLLKTLVETAISNPNDHRLLSSYPELIADALAAYQVKYPPAHGSFTEFNDAFLALKVDTRYLVRS